MHTVTRADTEQTMPAIHPEVEQPLATLVVALFVGILVGGVTALLQGWLPDVLQPLSNSAGPWSAVAFVLARRTSRMWTSILTGILILWCSEIGYVVTSALKGHDSASSTVAFWMLAGLLAGPALGGAAAWSLSTSPIRAGAGGLAALAAAVVLVLPQHVSL